MQTIIENLKSEYGNRLNFGASAVFTLDNGIIFSLVKKDKWRINQNNEAVIDFSGIGGGIEKDENPFECLTREIQEEVGLKVGEYTFSKNTSTILLINGKIIKKIVSNNIDQPNPIIISIQEVPRKNLGEKQQTFTHIALFIYQVKVTNIPVLHESDIPGLVYFKDSKKDEYFKEIKLDLQSNSNNDIEILPNPNFGKLPSIINLEPKFTPKSLYDSGLKFKDLYF